MTCCAALQTRTRTTPLSQRRPQRSREVRCGDERRESETRGTKGDPAKQENGGPGASEVDVETRSKKGEETGKGREG